MNVSANNLLTPTHPFLHSLKLWCN